MPRKLSEISKTARQQQIYNILRHCSEDSSMTVTEIHHRLVQDGVKSCGKTIKRDLEEMSDTHKLLSSETMPIRFYCSDDYQPDYQMTFSESELQTMILAIEGLKEMSSPDMKELCRKTETILLGKLPKEVAQDFEKLKSRTVVTPSFRGESALNNSESFRQVMKALKENRQIECENHSPYKDESYCRIKRTFSPLYLNMAGSEHYLMVHDHEDQKFKRLKIGRLKDVKILAAKVDPKLQTQFQDLDNSIGGFGGPDMPVVKYTITCDRIMAILFGERQIHASQKIEQFGEKYIITFEANPSQEIERYLAGWAPHIHELEPAESYAELLKIWQAGIQINQKLKIA